MFEPYLCPICHRNRTHFTLIYKLEQEVQLDPKTGVPVFESQELEPVLRPDGTPDLEVRCARCNYVASETAFIPRRSPENGKTQPRRRGL